MTDHDVRTPEGRAALRALCAAPVTGPYVAMRDMVAIDEAGYLLAERARTALPAALDYIDELEAKIEDMEAKMQAEGAP